MTVVHKKSHPMVLFGYGIGLRLSYELDVRYPDLVAYGGSGFFAHLTEDNDRRLVRNPVRQIESFRRYLIGDHHALNDTVPVPELQEADSAR